MISLRTFIAVLAPALILWPAFASAQSQSSEDKEDRPAAISTEEKTEAAEDTGTTGDTANETQAAAPTQEKTASGNEGAESAGEDPPKSLIVASWGGAYGESQNQAYFAPFKDETGIAVEMVSHNGEFAALTNADDSPTTGWDIVDIGPEVLESACRDGKLEKIDAASLATAEDGTPAREDFLPGTLHECGVPSVAWSSAIVFDKRAFEKATPKKAADFFNIKKFPGKRALPRKPKYILELALMADGVAPDKVYETLSSDEGVGRALEQLDAIRDHIVWWERAYKPLALLSERKAVMGLAFNGRIFSAIVAENKPFGVVWDGQIYDLDFWAVPKRSDHKKTSLEFIKFATSPERMAQQARWFPYGPVRKSAIPLVGKHPEVEVDMMAYIPTSGKNFNRALRLDTSWWREHADEMARRLKVWRIGDGGSAGSGLDAEAEMRQ